MFYPYNQTLQPVVCSNCHTQEWATSQLGVIQSLTDELVANATNTVDKAKAAITVANQTSGVDKTKLTSASSMVETAESILESINRDASKGFHNPEQTYTVLGEAARLAGEAQSTALTARADALSTQSTDLQTQVSNLQNQVSTLQTDISDLETKIDGLQSTVATVPYLYGGIGLAIGFVIGAAILFVLRRGKK
jgi:chromosome segregation ATPase